MGTSSLLRQIEHALYEVDIEGLVAIGAPGNEYESEACLIKTAIAKATNLEQGSITKEQVDVIVTEIWGDMFGPFSTEDLEQRRPGFSVIAQKIVAAL